MTERLQNTVTAYLSACGVIGRGNGEQELHHVFRNAELSPQPCVIVIDDLHLLAQGRSNGCLTGTLCMALTHGALYRDRRPGHQQDTGRVDCGLARLHPGMSPQTRST